MAEKLRNLAPLTIDFNWLIFIFNSHHNLFGRLPKISDLQKRMIVFDSCLTSLTEIKVRTYGTFVSNTNYSFLAAAITVNSVMDYFTWNSFYSFINIGFLDNNRAIFHAFLTSIDWLSRFFFDLLRNFSFDLRNYWWEHSFQLLFNQRLFNFLNLRLKLFDHFSLFGNKMLIKRWLFRKRNVMDNLNFRDFLLDGLNSRFLKLYLIGSLNKLFIVFANSNADTFETRFK